MRNVKIQGVEMPLEAARNVEEAGVDVLADILDMRRRLDGGALLCRCHAELVARCLDGAEPDRVEGWHEYAEVVVDIATSPKTEWRKFATTH